MILPSELSVPFELNVHIYSIILTAILFLVLLQLFRADLISAMKLPDSMPLESGSFLTIKEPWRTEWEIGVQVSSKVTQSDWGGGRGLCLRHN